MVNFILKYLTEEDVATYMTKQAAEELGVTERTIQKYCKDLDIQRLGKYYLIDTRAFNKIKKALAEAKVGNPGTPRKRKSN